MPGSRFTIARGMLLVAAIALVMGVAMTPGLGPSLGLMVIPSTVVAVGAFLIGRKLVELVQGYRCPGCGVRGLERRAIRSFGERFFLCPACGVRCRRSPLGSHAMFRWRDASGPEFDAHFVKPVEEDPWNGPPGLEDENEAGLFSKTHMNLVRSKRHRRPENPNGPGLE